jgi:hypothetical protein
MDTAKISSPCSFDDDILLRNLANAPVVFTCDTSAVLFGPTAADQDNLGDTPLAACKEK